jgi:membrane protease YdiL (CAAX protease family)
VALAQSRARSFAEIGVLVAVMAIWWPFLGPRLAAAHPPPLAILLDATILLGAVGIMTWLGGSAPSLGLGLAGVGRQLRAGILFVVPTYVAAGIVTITCAAVAIAAGAASLESLSQAKMPLVRLLGHTPPASILPIALFVAVYEEIGFRGFLLSRVVALAGPTTGIVATSVLFGVLHAPTQGWLGVAQTTCVGAVLATLTLRRRSLWPAIACHATIDTLALAILLVVSHTVGSAATVPN